MSAMLKLTQLTDKIAAATAEIAKMQEQLPALIAAVAFEAASLISEAPKEAPKEALVEAPMESKKKPASDGTMAWHAFVSHVQKMQPSRFTELKKHSDVLHEAKAIREEDEDAYKTFISSWKTERMARAPSVEIADQVVEVPKRKVAVGTMAWHAFVAHCKAVMPDLEGVSNTEKLQVIKAHKENDAAGYEAFVAEWKAVQA